MNDFSLRSSKIYVWGNLRKEFPEVIRENKGEIIDDRIERAYKRVEENRGRTDDLGGFYKGTARNEQAVWNDFLDYVWDYTCDRCKISTGCNYCSGYYKESNVVGIVLENIEELYKEEPYDRESNYKEIYTVKELAVMDDEDILEDVLYEISNDIVNEEGILDFYKGKIFEDGIEEYEEIKEELYAEFSERFDDKVELFAKYYDEIMKKKDNNEYWQGVVYEATKGEVE